MSSESMLAHTLRLEPQPGGINQELHLKQGCSSGKLKFLFTRYDILPDIAYKDVILRARLPGGRDLFATTKSSYEDGKLAANFMHEILTQMAAVAGEYLCTLTIVDADEIITRSNYMNHDFQTVIPFRVIVHAREG